MRVYIATTATKIKELLDLGVAEFAEYLTPEQFEFDSGVGEEEQEHLISLLAADDSLEMNQGKIGLVLAIDLTEEQINGDSVSVNFKQIAALLTSEDGEELTWYAPEEIAFQIASWL